VLLSLFALFFTACKTDFPVNAQWEEITVVYGLLDADKDTQYIRINKAFLGEEDALLMAQYSDSLNFNASSLDVKIHKLAGNDTLMSITMDTTTLINKEDGLFAVDNNIIYSVVTPVDFLTRNNIYGLTVRNKTTGNEVSSSTEIIDDFEFIANTQALSSINFYNPDSGEPNIDSNNVFAGQTISWNEVANGEIYQFDLKFNYLENNVMKSLIWSQPLQTSGGVLMQSKLESIKFFNFLRQSLAKDDAVVRQVVNVDLVMTVGTETLNTYLKINTPITEISQQRPQFTNITNGLGIFSSRYTYSLTKDLGDCTRLYLIEELDRNFYLNLALEAIECDQ
jgi:hypothetical protein